MKQTFESRFLACHFYWSNSNSVRVVQTSHPSSSPRQLCNCLYYPAPQAADSTKMATKDEYEKEKEGWANIKKEYEGKKAEHEKRMSEWDRNRGERVRRSQGLGEVVLNSQILHPLYVSSDSGSRLEDGLANTLGRSGSIMDDKLSLSQNADRDRKQERKTERDNIAPSRIPVAVSRLGRKEHLPAVPSTSMMRPRRRIQTRLEVSRTGSPSRTSTLLSTDCPALGLSKDESIVPPAPPRPVPRTPSRETLANPKNLLSSSRMFLPGSMLPTTPPVTPTRVRSKGRVLDESWRTYSSSSSSVPSLSPLPSTFLVAAAATTTMTKADETTTTTYPTPRISFKAEPSCSVVSGPQAVTEEKSFWDYTPSPSPSPTKLKKVAVVAAKSFGTIRSKLSRTNLRDNKEVARVGSNNPSGSGGAPGRGQASQGTAVTSWAPGPTAPIASGDRAFGSAVIPTARNPFSSSSSSPFVSTAPAAATTTRPPMRPPRPSDAEVAFAFALVQVPTTADQDALSVPRDDPFFTNRSALRTAAAAAAPSGPASALANPSSVRPPLPPSSPERPALKKKSLVDIFLRRKQTEEKNKKKKDGGAGPSG
ncbi:hypothetical protein QBC38DRAFT_220520 [Podospora fimiseda]|uniref:Uncharacterized protein n=1 Tax=Podospora fimiseda TaxID=252190 RepID=A0AAN7BNM2_9PEZI|nr:hypothetical protein QBC38DRAFT_220520 [Podospora fimiseda]